MITLPETNIFAPKNGWLEYDPFLLGIFGLFSGANLLLVSGRVTGLKIFHGIFPAPLCNTKDSNPGPNLRVQQNFTQPKPPKYDLCMTFDIITDQHLFRRFPLLYQHIKKYIDRL